MLWSLWSCKCRLECLSCCGTWKLGHCRSAGLGKCVKRSGRSERAFWSFKNRWLPILMRTYQSFWSLQDNQGFISSTMGGGGHIGLHTLQVGWTKKWGNRRWRGARISVHGASRGQDTCLLAQEEKHHQTELHCYLGWGIIGLQRLFWCSNYRLTCHMHHH